MLPGLLEATVPPNSSVLRGSRLHLSPPTPILEVEYEVAAPAAPKPDLPRPPPARVGPPLVKAVLRVQMPFHPQWPEHTVPRVLG